MAEGPNNLQLALDALNDYCTLWKLNINIEKTKIIRFSKGPPKKTIQPFLLNGQTVERVDSYIYLGTTIRFDGKLSDAIEKQVNHAHKVLFVVISKKEKVNLPMGTVGG